MPSNRALYVDLSLIYKTVLYILWSVIFTNIQCCEVLQKLTNPLYWQGTFAILSLFSFLISKKSLKLIIVDYCKFEFFVILGCLLTLQCTIIFFLYSWFTCKVLIKLFSFMLTSDFILNQADRTIFYLRSLLYVQTFYTIFFLIIKQTLIFNYK